ncbi:threonine/homoserine/homoserine lactone efflux protein [Methylosinus sp. sav-2]|uniref:LysE family translocator n=1 Tax=Methylosinus sp. sav-2 TaxID=2485168 RepID=UPI00047C667E|nr:LysE family translocator [Methylosinus sp. sav-2]TDX62711.1 threonine/homoserine/homoserine lactone efflux protein [Methylosinus sp. sav-2]
MSGRYLVFVATVVSLIAVPGPDMLYVLGRALASGARAGRFSAAGIAFGYALLTLLVAAGFQLVFAAFPALFLALKYIGVAYLSWLAFRLIRSDGGFEALSRGPGRTDWAAFSAGVGTSLLNPKGLLFYFAILPQFFDAADGPFWRHALVYGWTTSFLCLTLYSALAHAASSGARRWTPEPSASRNLSRLAGVLLLMSVLAMLGAEWSGAAASR